MYVADYVLMEYGTGAIMAVPAHDDRDFDFAQAFGLPVRQVVAPSQGEVELPFIDKGGDARIVNSGQFDGQTPAGAQGRDRQLARSRGQGPPLGQLPPARLAALPPALLGLPDPDRPLRRLRHRAGARGRSAGAAARRRGLRAQGPFTAGRGTGLGQRRLPGVRQAGAPRDRHDGHLRRFVLVLPALHRRRQRRGAVGSRRARQLDGGRPVHRRRRARHPAPAVRALLRQGVRRHGAARGRGAVQGPVHDRDDHARRREDVQVQGQRHLAARLCGALRRRHGALLRAVHRPARSGRRLVRLRRRGRPSLPLAAVAAGRRRRPGRFAAHRATAGRPGGRRPRARAQGALGDREGHRATWPAASPSTPRSRR